MNEHPANFPAAIRQSGITLIELVVFMVIVSVAMAGIISSINFNVQHSADPVVKKQALALAEALLEEVELMPFTWCDPNDPNPGAEAAAEAASSSTSCSAGFAEALGPEAGESRSSATTPFDNVNDYNGYCMATAGCAVTSISDITGTTIPNLNGYTALVAVATADLGSITAASGAALRIRVTVTGPLNTTVVLEGYRTHYGT